MTAPSTDKAALRAALTARRNALTDADRQVAVQTMLARLTALDEWQAADVVCGYVATRGELDLTPLWQATVAAGKTYALPVTLSGTAEGCMCFRQTPGFCPEALMPGRFGIAEPPADDRFPVLFATGGTTASIYAPVARLLLILPGLGFDDGGYRLGYGGGYYDRALSALTEAGTQVTAVGLCPSCCRVPHLPRESHDRAADILIDERSVTRP